jgi:flagellar biosynthetic protein FlhB
MGDEEEKTEEPTPKKIEDAKKEGNVPKSQDTSAVVTLIAGAVALFFLLPYITEKLGLMMKHYFEFIGMELTVETVQNFMIFSLIELIPVIFSIAIPVMIAGLLAGWMQFGFVYTTKPLQPDLKKIDPIKGLKNLISLKKLIEGIKIVLKVGLVFGIATYISWLLIKELPTVTLFKLPDQLKWLVDNLLIIIIVMIGLFIVLAIIDIIFVRYNYFKQLRMTKQEVKDEHKNMEGDPQVKAKIREVQMKMARTRMLSDVSKSDVVVTNPTHYAVALRYDHEKENAPRVVAKGVDFLAFKIREVALENHVQIVENPPLARELYKVTEVGQTIPDHLFQAVAEVLAYVYKAKGNSNNM